MGLASEKLCYIATSSLIDWAHTQNDLCIIVSRLWSTFEIPHNYANTLKDKILYKVKI